MRSYLQLFLSSIQARNNAAGRSIVVAFTSTRPKEGVSYVVNSFGVELAQRTRQRTLIADVRTLQEVDLCHYSRVPEFCRPTSLPNLYTLSVDDQITENAEREGHLQVKAGDSKLEQGLSNLQTLRFAFDFVLLDCSAFSVSGDAALFAPATDGVVLVVEANRSRRAEVRNSLNTIEMAAGNVLGCVINKRRYPVPNWLYQRL